MEIVNFEQVFDIDSIAKRVVNQLSLGNVVCMPADAGYVLLVSADAYAKIEKIREVLSYTEPAVFLVKNTKDVSGLVELNDDVLSQLIEEYMPGKLIIESDGVGLFESNLVRMRMIDSSLFREILQRFDGRVLCFEAGKTGGEAIYSDEQVLSFFCELDLISLFLNDGVLSMDRLPDIVKVSDKQISFTREGELVSLLVNQFSLKH